MNYIQEVENINKKLVLNFGYPLAEEKHLTNLTFSALAIAIYNTTELDQNKTDHIVWLTQYYINNFYKKEFKIEKILYSHKKIIQPKTQSVFSKDGKVKELKEIKRGEFRDINTYIDLKGHHIYFTDFRKIENDVNEMIEIFNNSNKTIEDISRILLEGFRIHPFMDGNGKTFRVLFDLLLIKNNYYPSMFNIVYKKNKPFFLKIFNYYIMVEKKKGMENFLESLTNVYKYSYFS
jgi:Fic family protein